MSRKRKFSNAIVYALVTLFIALYIIFFTGRVTDDQTGQTSWQWFTTSGIEKFRLGMDVSGGVRLTYIVDFAKYDQLYPAGERATYMKRTALDIIKKQIDKRVSVLGVSDYQAYTKTIDGDSYIIVELGGVHSLEQAKETIGKTVELEFKLAFDEAQADMEKVKQERSVVAQAMLTQVEQNPENFQRAGQNRESEDIFYYTYNQQPLSALPAVVQQNASAFASAQSGQIIGPWEGVFQRVLAPGANGEFALTELNGTTFMKFGSQEVVSVDQVDLTKLQTIASTQLSVDLVTKEQQDDQGVAAKDFSYDAATQTVTHNDGKQFEGQEAYKVTVYELAKKDTTDKTPEEITSITQELEKQQTQVLALLESGESVDSELAQQLVDNRWLAIETVSQLVPGFVWEGEPGTKTFDTLQKRYIVQMAQAKQVSEDLYTISTLGGIDATTFANIESQLRNETVVSAEVIFVKDTPTWMPAVDQVNGDLLNGAYFSRASLDTTQGAPTVTIEFDDKGKIVFCNITKENIGKQMAIFVGGQIVTSPVIQDEICGGQALINGQQSVSEARTLIDDLNEGALPAPLYLANEEKVSASLGERALQASLLAGGLGLVVIFLMLWLMYGHRKAIVGTVVLVFFLTYLFAFIKGIGYALSLSGIAAIILSLGMGIDANILIFERVREELKSGKTIRSAIESGYERSKNPIRDGNFSTLLIAIFLVGWGLGIFKGFGTMMILTTILILVVNVPLTKEFLHLAFSRKKDYLNDA